MMTTMTESLAQEREFNGEPGVKEFQRLAGDHTLVLTRSPAMDALSLVSPQGTVVLRIRVADNGLDVELSAASLRLRTEGELTLDAEQLILRGRESVDIRADRRIHLQAEEQRIEATLGDVIIEANDDVTMEGERILLNSAKPSDRPGPSARLAY